MSNPHPSSAPDPLPAPQRQGVPLRWVLWGALLLSVAVVGSRGIPAEIAAWHAAAAQNAVWAGDADEALAQFEQAMSWNPDKPDFWILRSRFQLSRSKFAEGLADARAAVEVAPHNAAAIRHFTETIERTKLATSAPDGLFDKQPYSATSLAARAELALALGATDQAIVDARLALARSPRNRDVIDTYCTAHVRAGQPEDAARIWENLLAGLEEGAWNSIEIRNGFAYFSAIAKKDLDRALKQVDQAIEEAKELGASPGDLSGLVDTRAYVLYRLGRHDEAEREIKAALAGMNPLGAANPQLRSTSIDERHLKHQLTHSQWGQLKIARRTRAVLLYHQALILEAQRDAAQDEETASYKDVDAWLTRQQVVELGYTPDETLF
jgi:tetratricopeptide (TPR) repeat protein